VFHSLLYYLNIQYTIQYTFDIINIYFEFKIKLNS